MMVSIISMNKLRKSVMICLWLLLWQAAAVLVHNSIMLVGPFEALLALWSLLPSADFWRSVAGSFGRISTGFLLAFAVGILLGSLAYTAPILEEILEPFMLFLKAVPVASFVILALIWAGSRNLSVVIAFLVVLPVIYVNTLAGLQSTDPKLLEFHLKSHGRTLWEFANGIGDAKVQSEETAAKGVGNSTTLPKDVEKAEDAKKVLFSLAESVGKRLRKAGQKANMVSVEIRYSDFQNVSHQKQLGRASGADQVIYEAACSLFDELWNGEPIRLLGVRTAKLVDEDEPEQLSLFDLQFEVKSEKPKKSMEKLKKLSAAMGEIRGKYGADAVIRGSVLEQREKEKKYEKKQF